MKFLITQIIIVILVCIFFAALSSLTELGVVGWIIAGSTGHALYKIYKHIQYNIKFDERKRKYSNDNFDSSNFSSQLQYFMFDDATELQDK